LFGVPVVSVDQQGASKPRPGLLASLALLGLVGSARWIVDRAPTVTAVVPVANDHSTVATKIDDQPTPTPPDHSSPLAAGPRDWKAILLRTYQQTNEDRLLAVAAGVVFYGLLALFPGITALVSSYALVADGNTINDHLNFISSVLPAGTFSIVQDQVSRVLAKGNTKLGFAFLLSFALALWSANGGMKAIIDSLNVVYNEQEKRGFFKLNAISLGFTLGSLGAVLAAIGLVVATPIVLATIGLGGTADALINYGRWPVLAGLTLLGLAVLYRYAPSRRQPQWKWISVGSVFATVTWLAGSAILSYYLANFADYDATYGSLGAAIGLMIWMWMTTIVVLLGAELNSEIEARLAAKEAAKS
jgi:membrane protein